MCFSTSVCFYNKSFLFRVTQESVCRIDTPSCETRVGPSHWLADGLAPSPSPSPPITVPAPPVPPLPGRRGAAGGSPEGHRRGPLPGLPRRGSAFPPPPPHIPRPSRAPPSFLPPAALFDETLGGCGGGGLGREDGGGDSIGSLPLFPPCAKQACPQRGVSAEAPVRVMLPRLVQGNSCSADWPPPLLLLVVP